VADATRDDRFARDPYFTDVGCCSLLALPILSRGNPGAMLLLENRLIRGAFNAERLDGVKLIAGQLTVSLDNARLYGELTTSRADRRRRRPGQATDRARPARRRPAATGLARPAAARGTGGDTARFR
jgi:GAF domain-containing protein